MASAPTEPPSYSGYQNLGIVHTQNTPAPLQSDSHVTRKDFGKVPYVTEEEAKYALTQFVKSHCCYGSGPVKNMSFDNIQSSDTFRYILQTYTETRSTAYSSEPHSGAPIYVNGNPPAPWDILVQPKILFNNEEVKLEIPNTSHVENCRKCIGMGTSVCYSCEGKGTRRCGHCHGKGKVSDYGAINPVHHSEHHGHHGHHNEHHGHHGHHKEHHGHHNQGMHLCSRCNSSGFEPCSTCHRAGRIECTPCRGNGKLKWFLQLTVKFTNNKNDYLKQQSSQIPDELIRECQAQNIFSEQNVRLYPINHHPDFDINNASNRLINDHASKFSNSRILAQRHDLNVIPMTQCFYTWKDRQHSFQIYGLDQLVYAPSYPQKCCCTIL